MTEINTALNNVLKECRNLAHDEGKGHGKSLNYSYISNEKVMDFFRPLLAKNGLSFSFAITSGACSRQDVPAKDGGTRRVYAFEGTALATLRHTSGEEVCVPWYIVGQNDGGADKAFGSALTYGKRYFFLNQFLVASSDEEDPDEREESTPKHQPPTLEQMERQLIHYATEKGLIEDVKAYKDEHFAGRKTSELAEKELQELFAYVKQLGG